MKVQAMDAYGFLKVQESHKSRGRSPRPLPSMSLDEAMSLAQGIKDGVLVPAPIPTPAGAVIPGYYSRNRLPSLLAYNCKHPEAIRIIAALMDFDAPDSDLGACGNAEIPNSDEA